MIIEFFYAPVGFPTGPVLVTNVFFGVKPRGANSPFPYGFLVESDR